METSTIASSHQKKPTPDGERTDSGSARQSSSGAADDGNPIEVIESNPGSRFTVVALSYLAVLGLCAGALVVAYWLI